MAYSLKIKEEELKNKVAQDYFPDFDNTKIIGNIDFCISHKKNDGISFLWAEAKKGNHHDIYASFVQLILTIGKERSFEDNAPPPFLGAFDAEKIAFLPFHNILDIFNINDFNWNAPPSNHYSPEFGIIKEKVISSLDKGLIIFHFDEDEADIKNFIKQNFVPDNGNYSKIAINRNNFTSIYYKWLAQVKDTIGINWEKAKEKGIIDADFYLADVLSQENSTLTDKLFVLLKNDHYEFDRNIDDIMGTLSTTSASFRDSQKAHIKFWNIYERPPKEEFWDFIIQRRDLLLPQDLRERRGSFFTPQKWVELSQCYLAEELGEDWQDKYYIWDCAAGTGNLLSGLTDKYNIWASTIDQSDVDIIKERIKNGANLLESHVFKFDFLNDDFSALPTGLREIIEDGNKRKNLLIYINPPYAEAATTRTIVTGVNKNKTNVAVQNRVYAKYKDKIGIAGRELFIQFLTRIYGEIPGCKIGQFSKLKALQAPNFKQFRQFFQADLRRLFITPANTFDNVRGQFPIGFFIWDTAVRKEFKKITGTVYDRNINKIGSKKYKNIDDKKSINDWIISTRNRKYKYIIGYLACYGCDFQHAKNTFIVNSKENLKSPRGTYITDQNLKEAAVYYAVRKCINETWLNDRDQFRFPDSSWRNDTEFQNNCLVYTLFNTNIKSAAGVNHWLPFKENEIQAKDKFASDFMYKYINGSHEKELLLPTSQQAASPDKLEFSANAKNVLEAGRRLFLYYHTQNLNADPNASLWDIKSFFQLKNIANDKMGNASDDDKYNELIRTLRKTLRILSLDIIPKIYEYGFLIQ